MIKIYPDHIYQGHSGAVYALSKGFSEEQFFSVGGDGSLVEWTLSSDTGKMVAMFNEPVFSICVDENHSTIYCGTQVGNLYKISYSKEEKPQSLIIHRGAIFEIKIFEDNIYTIGSDGMLAEINRADFKFQIAWKISYSGLRTFELDSMNRCYYIAGQNGLIFKFDLQSKASGLVYSIESQKTIFTIALDVSSYTLYIGGMDALLRALDIRNCKELAEPIKAHWFTINSIKIIEPHALIATSSRDKSIRLWEMETLKLIKEISISKYNGNERSVNNLLWMESSNLLISASDSKLVKSWKIIEDDINR